jgi:RNA polymerase-binding transcription factor DksA
MTEGKKKTQKEHEQMLMDSERKKLEEERTQTLAELDKLRAYLKYEIDHTGDEVDLDVYEREKNLALVQTLERKLESIEYALSTHCARLRRAPTASVNAVANPSIRSG